MQTFPNPKSLQILCSLAYAILGSTTSLKKSLGKIWNRRFIPFDNFSFNSMWCGQLFIFQPTVFLLMCTLLNAAGLLVHSTDRLLAITAPIYYYHNCLKIENCLLCCLYAMAVVPMLTAIIFTVLQPSRNITIYCRWDTISVQYSTVRWILEHEKYI